MRKVIAAVIGIILAPLILYAGVAATLWIMGYEFAQGPDILAQRLMDEGRPAKDCRLYVTLDPWFRPPTRELRDRCIWEYARLTSDPSTCQLLMPSEYGLSCIGAASESQPCFLANDRSVRWNTHGGEATLEQCVNQGQGTEEGKQCCTIARVSSLNGHDDCSTLAKNPRMSDQCFGELADKKKEPTICAKIQSSNLRSACFVRVTAIAKYPDLPHVGPIDYRP